MNLNLSGSKTQNYFSSTKPGDPVPEPEKLLRLKDVMLRTALGRSTIYDQIGKRRFPAPINLGGRRVAWLESEVSSWVQERIAASRQSGG